MTKRSTCLALLLLATAAACCRAQGGAVLTNVPYKTGAGLSDYEKERCVLDVYLPPERKGFPTLVWFHGGGLTGGNKEGADTQRVARSLAQAGVCVVVPNYRLSPKALFPAYIQDAAASVAWARAYAGEHGGDPARLFIAGHSAGGYLALMLGLDAHYLQDLGIPPEAVAGVIPVSGQTMTHYTVRAESGVGKFSVTADEGAPVHFARKETPPLLVLYADNDMPARLEENAYLVALLKAAGNTRVTGRLIADRTHGSIASKIADEGDPARLAILAFIRGDG